MFQMATDEEAVYQDVIITDEGGAIPITRPLTIAEKLGLLKASAPYYAPSLKSIDQKSTLDVSAMSTDELKAKILAMSKDIADEQDE
jgi:hypothetical protein